MSYKKMLIVILIVIGVMFALMLTTSYAWYSYEGGSTTFDAVTSNDDIEVVYMQGEAIYTEIAVPISEENVDKYSDKNNFTVRVKDNVDDNEIAVTVSLVDIEIDSELQDSNFRIELYYQGSKLSSASTSGDNLTSGSKDLGTITLDSDVDNNFELRIYLLDDGSDQSLMMNKSFQAKIEVNVVSRLKTTINDFSSPDIYISSITINGESSTYLPVSGYYDMTASCSKGSNLTWDSVNKVITYNSGSYVNDSCALTFTTSSDVLYLNEVAVGSYVQYTGSNGCTGKACEGQNANYVSDTNMGYCYNNNYKYLVNGWRVGYIQDGTAYLVSAGATECIANYFENKSSLATETVLGESYYYGSGYTFNADTGVYTLTGLIKLDWTNDYKKIITTYPYTCKSASDTGNCTTMYQVDEYYSETEGKVYLYYNYASKSQLDEYLEYLNNQSLKYCNKKYAYDGACNSSSAWSIGNTDFYYMTMSITGYGKSLSNYYSEIFGDVGGDLGNTLSCYGKASYQSCGYNNSLLDNGGYYWFAGREASDNNFSMYWNPTARFVDANESSYEFGLRPVLRLKASIVVTSGTGTYDDPYIISS